MEELYCLFHMLINSGQSVCYSAVAVYDIYSL